MHNSCYRSKYLRNDRKQHCSKALQKIAFKKRTTSVETKKKLYEIHPTGKLLEYYKPGQPRDWINGRDFMLKRAQNDCK